MGVATVGMTNGLGIVLARSDGSGGDGAQGCRSDQGQTGDALTGELVTTGNRWQVDARHLESG